MEMLSGAFIEKSSPVIDLCSLENAGFALLAKGADAFLRSPVMRDEAAGRAPRPPRTCPRPRRRRSSAWRSRWRAGPRSAIFSAQAFASASAVPVSTTRSTSPSAAPRAQAGSRRPAPCAARSARRSGAPARCVPDQPGTMPSDGLGQAELDLRLGDAEIAGGGKLQPAAQRMAVERGDRRHGAAAPGGRRRGGRSAPIWPKSCGAHAPPRPRYRRRRKRPCPRRSDEHDAHAVGILGGVAAQLRAPAASGCRSALSFSGRAA